VVFVKHGERSESPGAFAFCCVKGCGKELQRSQDHWVVYEGPDGDPSSVTVRGFCHSECRRPDWSIKE
jgi:hypothetical protein